MREGHTASRLAGWGAGGERKRLLARLHGEVKRKRRRREEEEEGRKKELVEEVSSKKIGSFLTVLVAAACEFICFVVRFTLVI